MTRDDSFAVNRANWDERAPAHAASPDYDVQRFVDDPAHLSRVVRFDLPRLGDVANCRGVHLQCHIGTDTISLCRLGARMTGLDFSPAAIAQARVLADRCGADVDFVEANVYDAVDVLGVGLFDLVFTGIGALCWLPAIEPWARVVADLLRPGGRLFVREGHPMLWSLEEPSKTGGELAVRYPYFETPEPMVFDEGGTYVETDVAFTTTVTHSWNHGLGEIFGALQAQGLRLTMLEEHDSAPWNALPGLMSRGADDEWRLTGDRRLLPLTYTMQAVKSSA